jgi:hypothetical protein
MVIAKLKTGEIVELPLNEMLVFIAEYSNLIQIQHSEIPMPKRRSLQLNL